MGQTMGNGGGPGGHKKEVTGGIWENTGNNKQAENGVEVRTETRARAEEDGRRRKGVRRAGRGERERKKNGIAGVGES